MPLHPPSSILHPRRLLVRGVNWLGDAVMTTPALQRLRQRFPEAHITLLTHAKLADLWQDHPSLDAVITFPAKAGLWSIARRLRTGHFDTALVLPNSPRSALEVWLARIPQRFGYARSWRNAFLTRTVPTRPGHVRMHKRTPEEIQRLLAAEPPSHAPTLPRSHAPTDAPSPICNLQSAICNSHQIHEYLHLAATALGANPAPLPPQLHVPPHFYPTLTARFGISPGPRPLFGLNAGAEYGPAKRWPADRFLAAAVELQQRTRCQWLIFGGPADVQLAGEIAAGIQHQISQDHSLAPPLNVAGKTTLRELMALLKRCGVLLTNDTGPMHLAAALDTPVVALFGSTSPELTGPGLPGDPRHRLLKAHVPCAPCFLRTCPIDFRCMHSLTTDQVIEAVLHLSA